MKNKIDGSIGKTIKRVLMVLVLLFFVRAGLLSGADVIFYTQQYTRDSGKPQKIVNNFTINPLYTGEGFVLVIAANCSSNS